MGRTVAIVAMSLVAVAATLTTLTPAEAGAAAWTPCTYTVLQTDCASYDMPLDRTGAVAGTTRVRAVKVAAPEGPHQGTLFVIAGGPGQTSQVMIPLMTELFAGANRFDIVAVDQRGSGASEPLDCPRIETGTFEWSGDKPSTDRPITDCSNALGAARGAYNTAEAVADLEAIRADLGLDKISILGVSYGTKVALAYAKAHPASTSSLILDSVLPTDEPSAFDTAGVAAVRSAFDRLCAGKRCHAVGNNPIAKLEKLASRLRKDPLPTFVVSPTGKITEAEIDEQALYDIVFAADLNLFIDSQLPGTLTRAVRGEYDQLIRLYAVATGQFAASASRRDARRFARRAASQHRTKSRRVIGRDAFALSQFSATMYFATTCADFNPPWPRSENTADRQPFIQNAANQIPAAALRPFSRDVVRNSSTSSVCRGWQQRPALPTINQGPLPPVPTLALAGTLDTRTPLTWAEKATAGNPLAQVVPIPSSGHSVIGTDVSGCALSLAKRFLIFGATDGKCKESTKALPIAPLPPNSISTTAQLKGTCRNIPGPACQRAKREITAGYLALRDTLDQVLIGGQDAGMGLLGGDWFMEYDISDDLETLFPVGFDMGGITTVPDAETSGFVEITALPSVRSRITVGEWRVNVSGSVQYDRAGDKLTLAARDGRRRVTVQVRPRVRSARSTVTAGRLGVRRNYLLGTTAQAWQLP